MTRGQPGGRAAETMPKSKCAPVHDIIDDSNNVNDNDIINDNLII